MTKISALIRLSIVWHVQATFVWQRPSEIQGGKKKERGTSEHLILFYPFVYKVQGGGRLVGGGGGAVAG